MVLTRAISSFVRPAEWARHSHCILAWPGLNNSTFQTSASLTAATNEVSSLVKAIARFEPVTLVVGQERLHEARSEFESGSSTVKHEVRINPILGDDMNLWMRDIAPTFTLYQQEKKPAQQLSGVDFNFNGWGNRHATAATVTLARTLLENMKTNRIKASITTEGGALEIDGEGTLLVTESSIINNNRNPGKSKEDIEKELQRCLGVSKIIWVPGVMNADSTDCHIDALARFARPGVVLLSRPMGPRAKTVWMKVYEETKDILLNQQDAQGRSLRIIDIPEPDMALLNLDEESMEAVETASGWSPVMSYVNYYLPNGGLVVPKFGDEEADIRAFEILTSLFENEREAVQVYINELPLQGGGIHCATQEVPLS
ncbi:putative agmatine deiminase [Talaromyces proteolyticus]|uniref:Agmatine deiminase n=1 Tax=Talaromyces proteolyticus TaxID=1131652 RepID=A0AAD4Q0U8_9EURO|nr:putative agmatine deiminase [Talaromyces proteolyticus]KAH8704890.1 putative agmatine deiminase [Talaromyces proteolyticus]